MVDPATGRKAADLLAVAIAEIIEDTHEIAVINRPRGLNLRARKLETAGRDIAALAMAMGVLTRAAGQPHLRRAKRKGGI